MSFPSFVGPKVVRGVPFQIRLQQIVVLLHYLMRGHRGRVPAYFLERPFIVTSRDRVEAHVEDAVAELVGDRSPAEHRPCGLVHEIHHIIGGGDPVRALVGREYVEFPAAAVREGVAQDIGGADVALIAVPQHRSAPVHTHHVIPQGAAQRLVDNNHIIDIVGTPLLFGTVVKGDASAGQLPVAEMAVQDNDSGTRVEGLLDDLWVGELDKVLFVKPFRVPASAEPDRLRYDLA